MGQFFLLFHVSLWVLLKVCCLFFSYFISLDCGPVFLCSRISWQLLYTSIKQSSRGLELWKSNNRESGSELKHQLILPKQQTVVKVQWFFSNSNLDQLKTSKEVKVSRSHNPYDPVTLELPQQHYCVKSSKCLLARVAWENKRSNQCSKAPGLSDTGNLYFWRLP